MPVRAVAGQTRDLQAQHDADQAEADVGYQPLKAWASAGVGGRLPEVVVNDDDLLRVPAQGHGLFTEAVLPLGALAVLFRLEEGRLANVEVRLAPEVLRRDLARVAHGWSPGNEGRRTPER